MAGRIDIMGRPILIPTYVQCKLTVYISVRLALRAPSASATLLGFNQQSGQELVLIRVSKQGLVGTDTHVLRSNVELVHTSVQNCGFPFSRYYMIGVSCNIDST